MLKITLVNHASVIIESNSTKLLFDPWFVGYAFGGGWGLTYDNSAAFEMVRTCTHVWISHFHSDHFHVPTLKKILEVHPEIIAIGNNSYNFNMASILGGIGFGNVEHFGERESVRLGENFEIERIPATGIDNMLLMKIGEHRILNYNDCVLPTVSMRMIQRASGQIDILMLNYNHAGKLVRRDRDLDSLSIKQGLKDAFQTKVRVFDPMFIYPFASAHYYTSSANQNESLLSMDDVRMFDSRVLPVEIGGSLVFEGKHYRAIPAGSGVVVANDRTLRTNEKSFGSKQLSDAAGVFTKKVRSSFPLLWRILGPLTIFVSDLDSAFELNANGDFRLSDEIPDIRCSSEQLHLCFVKPYGANTFHIGAHYEIINSRTLNLTKWLLLTNLIDNKLDLRSLFGMIFSRAGLAFFWNRREEIIGVLLSGPRFLAKKAGKT